MPIRLLGGLMVATFGGASQLSATRAVANWDVVPFQRISQPFKAGIVAFHETGVDVAFQVNGLDAGTVQDPTWNDRTGVFEYWIELDPSQYADGPLVLSATAHPDGEGHESRVLEDLTLYANFGGTVGSDQVLWVDATNGDDTSGDGSEGNPYQTIRTAVLAVADGGTIYLKAGTNYKLSSIGGAAFTYWTTIAAAPGLSADDVHVAGYLKDGSSNGRYNKSGIRWHNLSLYCDRDPVWGTILYLNPGHKTWMDGVTWFDANGHLANSTLVNKEQPYMTDCYIHDVTNVFGNFHRNNRIETIGSDVFRGATNLTAINVHVDLMHRGDTGAHPDFLQFYNPDAPIENIILYNCRAYDMMAQGLFGGDGVVTDFAVVNLLLEKDPSDSSLMSQMGNSIDHCLLWNITIVDQSFSLRNTTNLWRFDVRNCVFNTFSASSATEIPNESFATHIHTKSLTWEQSQPLGDFPTTGDPMFVDYDNDDYRLQAGSPAHASALPLPGVPADIDGWPYDPVNPNRGAFAAVNPGGVAQAQGPVRILAAEMQEDTGASVVRWLTSFHGDPMGKYLVEASSNLSDWIRIASRTAGPDGILEISEVLEDGPLGRFYRFTPY